MRSGVSYGKSDDDEGDDDFFSDLSFWDNPDDIYNNGILIENKDNDGDEKQ